MELLLALMIMALGYWIGARRVALRASKPGRGLPPAGSPDAQPDADETMGPAPAAVMVRCGNCGNATARDATTCSQCGAELEPTWDDYGSRFVRTSPRRARRVPSAEDLRSQFGGLDGVVPLFLWSLRNSLGLLTSGQLAALDRGVVGNLGRLGWLDRRVLDELTDFFDAQAQRRKQRWALNRTAFAKLRDIVDDAGITTATGLFCIAQTIDSQYVAESITAGDRDWLIRRGVVRPAPAFFDDVRNPPPSIGQMTPVAIARRCVLLPADGAVQIRRVAQLCSHNRGVDGYRHGALALSEDGRLTAHEVQPACRARYKVPSRWYCNVAREGLR